MISLFVSISWLFASLKKINIMINYWEYLVLNIVINVITTYREYLFFFFFVSVNIVIKLFAKFFLKKKLILWLIVGNI